MSIITTRKNNKNLMVYIFMVFMIILAFQFVSVNVQAEDTQDIEVTEETFIEDIPVSDENYDHDISNGDDTSAVTEDSLENNNQEEAFILDVTSTPEIAKIEDETYSSLQEAIDAASEGKVIQLLQDVTENALIQKKNITLDLAGFTISGGNAGRVFTIRGGEVSIKNGTITQGSIYGNGAAIYLTDGASFIGDYLTITNHTNSGNNSTFGGVVYCDRNVSFTLSNSSITNNNTRAGAIFGNKNTTLNFLRVRFENNINVVRCSDILLNEQNSKLTLTSCYFGRNNGTSSKVFVNAKDSEIIIEDCDFTDLGPALSVSGMYQGITKLEVKGTRFTHTTIHSGAPDMIFVGFNTEATFNDCVISNNQYASSIENLIQLDDSSNTQFINCSISNNKYVGNVDSYSDNSTILVNGSATFKNTTIENNIAMTAGAIRLGHSSGSSNGNISFIDSVIKNNTAIGFSNNQVASYRGSAGGVNIYQGTFNLCSGAIYDNQILNVYGTDRKANDVFIAGKTNAYLISEIASNEMKDGDIDFSNRVWKDADVSYIENKPEPNVTGSNRFYTLIDNLVNIMVAQIGDRKFETLQEAIDAANPNDRISIIVDASILDSEELSINKNITIDFQGRDLRLSRQAAGNTLMSIGNDATVTFFNSRNDQFNGGGTIRGDILLNDGSSLIVEDSMKIHSVIHNGKSVILNATTEQVTNITLGEGKYLTLSDQWKEVADKNKSSFIVTLSDSAATSLNNGSKQDIKIAENGNENNIALFTISNVTNKRVIKKRNQKDIYLHVASGVFLAGNGNDALGRGLTPDQPVRTFSRAKALLQQDPNLEGIFITDTVYITDEEIWDLGSDKRPIYRYRDFKGNLIELQNNLTLRNIILDGQKDQMETGSTSLIKVYRGILTLDTGSELRNNNAVDTTKQLNGQHVVHGGAIISEQSAGSIIMKEGSWIHDNEAFFGGGIFIGQSTFDMQGGIIENNRALYYEHISNQLFNYASDGGRIYPKATGGGVMVAFGATMNMSDGAIIRNNSSDSWGGGICLGNNLDYYSKPGSYEKTGKIVTFNMNGGTIEGNWAKLNGGGLFVQCYTVANIYQGYILNNSTGTTDFISIYPTGGGIYVNGYYRNPEINGKLYIHNVVEMTKNESLYEGGAIMTCASSMSFIRDILGALIHDNQSPSNVEVFFSSNMEGLYNVPIRNHSYMSEYLPGGNEYNWNVSAMSTDGNGNLNDIVVPTQLGLNSSIDPSILDQAKNYATVYINNNTTHGGGGAIGNNGNLYIGSYRIKMDIKIEKEWDDIHKEEVRPESITLVLKQNDKKYREVVIKPDPLGHWEYLFENLPRYEIDVNTGKEDLTKEYSYTIEEVLTTAKDGNSYKTFITKEEGTRKATPSIDPLSSAEDIKVITFKLVNQYRHIIKIDPPIQKKIVGDPLDEEKVFTFEMRALSNNLGLSLSDMPMPENSINGIKVMEHIQKNQEEWIEFGEFEVELPGMYQYEIVEILGSDPTITYDTTRFIMSVLISEDPITHELEARITIENGEEIIFTNIYKKPSTPLDPTPDKEDIPSIPQPDKEKSFEKKEKSKKATEKTSIQSGGVQTGLTKGNGTFVVWILSILGVFRYKKRLHQV